MHSMDRCRLLLQMITMHSVGYMVFVCKRICVSALVTTVIDPCKNG